MRVIVCAVWIASSKMTCASALAAARASLAAPTAPSVRSLAAWISSHRTRMPSWSGTAPSMKAVMASV